MARANCSLIIIVASLTEGRKTTVRIPYYPGVRSTPVTRRVVAALDADPIAVKESAIMLRSTKLLFALAAMCLSASCKKEPPPTKPSPPPAKATATSAKTAAVPPPAAGKGNLSGEVQFGGKPVPGAEVKLCQKSSMFSGCEGRVYKAKAGPDGLYVLRDLPPGDYARLMVREPGASVWIYTGRSFGARKGLYQVRAGSTQSAGITHLFKSDLFIVSPRPAARLAGPKPEIRWAAYPGAAHYLVSLAPDYSTSGVHEPRFARVKVEEPKFVPDKPLPPGRWKLNLTALGSSAGNPKIAEAEERMFMVVPEGTAVPELPDSTPPPPRPEPPTLEPFKPAPDRGAVQGSVLFANRGAAGIEVKLCSEFDRFFRGCHGKTFTTKTDARGVYLFKDLPPMVYKGLTARVFKSKMVIFVAAGFAGMGNKAYPVKAGQTLVVPPTNLYKSDLKVLSPRAGARMPPIFEVKWAPYPNAAYYDLRINIDSLAKGAKPTKTPPYFGITVDQPSLLLDIPLEDGPYTVWLAAFDAWGTKLAETGGRVKFTVKKK